MEKNFLEHCKTSKKFIFIRINQKFEMRNFSCWTILSLVFFLLAIHPIRSINRLIDNFRQSHIHTHTHTHLDNNYQSRMGDEKWFFYLWEFFKCFYLINLNTDSKKKFHFNKQQFFSFYSFFVVANFVPKKVFRNFIGENDDMLSS